MTLYGLCELCVVRLHPLYLLKSSAAFVPPNPNEFDNAYPIGSDRLLFGT